MGLFDDIANAKKKQRGPEIPDFQPNKDGCTKPGPNPGETVPRGGTKAKYLVELLTMFPIFPKSGKPGMKQNFKILSCLEHSEGVTPNEPGTKAGIYLGSSSFSFLSDVRAMISVLSGEPENQVDADGVNSCYGLQFDEATNIPIIVARFEPTIRDEKKEAEAAKRYRKMPVTPHPLAGAKAILEVYLKDNGFADYTFSPAPAA